MSFLPLTPVPRSNAISEMDRGLRRIRRVRWTVVAALAGRGISMIVTFCTIPLTVGFLGSTQYGFWVAVMSITSLVALADLGLGYGLLTSASAPLGVEDCARARRFVSNAFLLLASIALVGLLGLFVLCKFLSWETWLPIATTSAFADCGRAGVCMVAAFLIGLPFAVWQRVASAAQIGYWNPLWDAMGSLLSLGGIVLVIRQQGDLLELAMASAAGPLMTALGGSLWFFGLLRPGLRPVGADFDFSIIRKLLVDGGCFFALQVGGLALPAFLSLIILQQRGPAELTNYNLVSKLFQIGPQLAAFWFAPLLPAYGEALAQSDTKWAHQTLQQITVAWSAIAFVAGALLVPLAGRLVNAWTGTQTNPPLSLCIGLAAVMVLAVATTSVSTFMSASGYLGGQVWFVILHVGTSLGLAWLLTNWWGSAGAVWATVIAYGTVVVPAYAVVLPRILSQQRARRGMTE